MNPQVSVIVPVYNEEEGLPLLFERLYPALDALGRSYEVVFVDDGSSDRSVAELREQFQKRPDVTRVVVLARNAGQHMPMPTSRAIRTVRSCSVSGACSWRATNCTAWRRTMRRRSGTSGAAHRMTGSSGTSTPAIPTSGSRCSWVCTSWRSGRRG